MVGWGAALVWFAAAACDVLEASRPEMGPSVSKPREQLHELTDDELRVRHAALMASLQLASGEEALSLSLAAADAARALTRRTGDVGHVRLASDVLLRTANAVHTARACEALLVRVHIHLVELSDLVAAHSAAVELVSRYSTASEASTCVTAATRVVDALADQPSVLAAARVVVAEERVATRDVAESADTVVGSADGEAWLQTRVPQADSSPATLERITVYGARAGTQVVRAVLYFSRPIRYRQGEAMAEAGLPRRLYLDFDGIVLGDTVDRVVPLSQGGLQRIRLLDLDPAELPPGGVRRTRVSFDVEGDVVYRAFFLGDPYRVVVDIQAKQTEVAGNKVRTIVLDPGHGGRNAGAHGPHGLREAVVALDLSRRVRALLRHELPGTRVVLTRETNEDLSLEERTAIANGENAQLFVSIHLNAWATSDQGGVATFVLDTSDDSQALRLAARENGTEVSEVSDLQKVLASLYRKEQVAQSLNLAEAIHQQTLQSGRAVLPELVDRGVKRAMFYVLVGATMPAVLVEPSFITNPDEAQALTTDAYRDRLAAGIALGIAKYARSL